MSDLSQVGMENALSRYSRRTTIGDWIVASGSTTTVINVTKSDNTAVSLSTNVINDLTNSMISFEAPGVNEGQYRHIASITDAGTITLDQALSKTPVAGDPFTILTLMSVDVTASENIAQIGGTGQTGADWTTFFQGLYDAVIAAGVAIPSKTLQVSGSDGTDARALSTDATGAVKLAAGTNNIGSVSEASIDASTGTAGTAVPAKTIQVGGTDGTDLRTLATDATGAVKLAAGTNQIGTMQDVGWNTNLGHYSVTFAASAAADTVETVSVPLPSPVQKDALYLVSVNNPSGLGTSVTVTFNNGMQFGGSTTSYSEVTSVDVASGAVKSYLIQGWLLGDADAQISASNDAAASSTGGTVDFEVIRI